MKSYAIIVFLYIVLKLCLSSQLNATGDGIHLREKKQISYSLKRCFMCILHINNHVHTPFEMLE